MSNAALRSRRATRETDLLSESRSKSLTTFSTAVSVCDQLCRQIALIQVNCYKIDVAKVV